MTSSLKTKSASMSSFCKLEHLAQTQIKCRFLNKNTRYGLYLYQIFDMLCKN